MIFFGTTCRLPEHARIGIFNRSYYEEALVVRVHPELLLNQGLAEPFRDGKSLWKERYRSIVDLERHPHLNGTKIIKFFLHLSKEEQRKRFLERIDEPDKNWKLSLADIRERKFWQHYMEAYENCLEATSTPAAPWFIVPADDKADSRLIVSQIVLDSLNGLKMAYPKTSATLAGIEIYPQTTLKTKPWGCPLDENRQHGRIQRVKFKRQILPSLDICRSETARSEGALNRMYLVASR